MVKFKIEVVQYDTLEVVKSFSASNSSSANRIDDGLNINLDHDNYFTRIIINTEPETDKEKQ